MPNFLELLDPRALHVKWVLAQAGHETRLCGGAVRDILLQQTPKDWDLATTATPDRVIEVMNQEGIHVIPTGLQHGTVTAVFEGEHFEITTLRVDQETDGRHATVEFTEDWKLDAARRDFTMNAMYIDQDGELHDYHNGKRDLLLRAVEFVGDPEQRIQEDYLRILRYFRFRGRMMNDVTKPSSPHGWTWHDSDKPAKDAIEKHVGGLSAISGERIWMELQKILVLHQSALATFNAMYASQVLEQIGLNDITRWYNLSTIRRTDERPSVILASLYHRDHVDKAHQVLKDVFNASNEETRPVDFYVKNQSNLPTRITASRLLAHHSKEDVLAWIAIRADHSDSKVVQPKSKPVSELYRWVQDLDVPPFPVSGKDLMDLGVKPGPQMGEILNQLKEVWADLEFVADRDYLINLVHLTDGEIK